MARLTGIFFVTGLAAGAIPCGDGTVRLPPEEIIVRGRLHDTVAFRAGVLRVANAARGIELHAELAMALHPSVVVISRFLIAIHVDVARQAILSRHVRFVAYLYDFIARKPGHRC
ncbi:MAG: hypothetical protein KJN67_02175 [Pontiella sp.]|nr:hypothetical protein [Pontiella sp.]